MFLPLVLLFFMGAILPFAFAPFGVYTLAFISPAVLLYQWQQSTPGQAFIKGGVFGLGFYGAGVSWVFISIHTYGNASALVSGLITGAMIVFLSLGPATQGYVLMRLFGKKNQLMLCLAAFPAFWVIWEWLRSLPLNGFPWLYLGYTQLTTPLRGFAPLIGVYGVSLLVAILCGCLVIFGTRQWLRYKIGALVIFIVVIGCGWWLTGRHWTKPDGSPFNVALIQANISQSIKWKPGEFEQMVKTYTELTQPYWGKSRLIIWPEAALPAFSDQIPDLLAELGQKGAEQQSTLLTGILLRDPASQQYYNGVILLGADHGEYRKRHLVPFGEYTPLKSVFSFLINYWQIPMSNFSPGSVQQKPLTLNGGVRIAPFLCYEIAYPLEVLKYSRDSEVLVNISDDSWFGKSLASAQQAQMAQMRALETGRFVLLGANTGITGIIDPFGHFMALLPPHQIGTLSKIVTPMQGKTPLMRWDYYPLLVIVLILLLLTYV